MGVAGYDLLKIATQKNLTSVMLTAHALSPENVTKSYKGESLNKTNSFSEPSGTNFLSELKNDHEMRALEEY